MGVAIAAVVSGCGGHRAVTRTISTSGTAPGPDFTKTEVTRAFQDAGLTLYDPAPGPSSPHEFATVTMLATVQPHDGWTVAAYIYPTPNQANASFAQDAGEWSASGIASAQVRNLVVVVIPRGHVLSRRAALFPMPKLVYKALGFLPHSR